MATRRRVKDVQYEDEDLDDYGDDEMDQGKTAYYRMSYIIVTDIYKMQNSAETIFVRDQPETYLTQHSDLCVVKMDEGVAQVQEALGPNYNIPRSAIQDALWYYYFDVNQSVAYLKGMPIPAIKQLLSIVPHNPMLTIYLLTDHHKPKQPKQKLPTRFDLAQTAADIKFPVPISMFAFPLSPFPSINHLDYLEDVVGILENSQRTLIAHFVR